jgi:hypothetical protein
VFWRTGLGLRRDGARQQVQCARGGAHLAGGNAQVSSGSRQTAMGQQQLNGADVGASLKPVNCEGMTKQVRRDRFANAARTMGFPARLLHGVLADMPAGEIARKEPMLGPCHPPPVARDPEQLRARASRSDPSVLCPARHVRPPNTSGDWLRWRANSETCCTQDVWVCGERFRICMSSIMRCRRDVVENPCI